MKKIRIRCSTIAATNTSAAQWCVWRISRPALTSKERSTRRAVRLAHRRAAQRRVGPSVDDVSPSARLEEQRQVDPGRDEHDERSTSRPRRAGTTSGRGTRSASPCAANGAAPERSSTKRIGSLERVASHRRLRAHAPPGRPGRAGEVARRAQQPSAPIISGSCGSGRPAGPNSTLPAAGDVERRVVAGADERVVGLRRARTADCGTARPRSRRACRSSSRRRCRPAPSPRGPAAGASAVGIERARRRAATRSRPCRRPPGRPCRTCRCRSRRRTAACPCSSTRRRPRAPRRLVRARLRVEERAERDGRGDQRDAERPAGEARRARPAAACA